MTKLGEYLQSKSINQSEIARKTGLSKARVNQLCNNSTTRLGAEELYKILLAINVDPCEGFRILFKDIKLKSLQSKS